MGNDRREASEDRSGEIAAIAIAPKFTPEERRRIADWSAKVKWYSWKTEFNVAHEFIQ